MSKNGHHWVVLKVALSAGLIYWILRDADLESVWATIAGANRGLLTLAFMSYFVGYYLTANRWGLLLRAQGIIAPVFYLCKSFMVAVFFNNFLPSTVGGDAVRMFDSWRLGNSKTDAVTVIFVDRFIGMLALLAFALVGALLADGLSDLIPLLGVWIVAGTVAAFALAFFIFFPPQSLLDHLSERPIPLPRKLQGIVSKIINAVALFRGRYDALLPAAGLSLLLQANVVLHYFLVSEALGLSVPFYSFFVIVPIAIFIMMVPISINGIGVRESVFAFFLAAYGVGQSEAVAFAWTIYGLILLQGVLGGLVFAFRRWSVHERVQAVECRSKEV